MDNFEIPEWVELKQIDYSPITTFWEDFSIAENFGVRAIQDTYNRAMEEWKHNYKYLTELVMVLNHKCWAWYRNKNSEYSILYENLFFEAQDYGYEHLKGEELNYFWRTLD